MPASPLDRDLDSIFAAPVLARALVGIRVDSLATGQTLYARNANKLVMPASNMKLLTMSAAAEKLGWNFTYTTTLEAAGTVADGVLHGDLIVTGSGDPTIASQDFGPSPVFLEWAAALQKGGINRVDGRLIGDDRAFDKQILGDGWAWDYLGDGYAAPIGALTYNENLAVVRLWAGKAAGDPVRVELSPPGHGLDVVNRVTTGAADVTRNVNLFRVFGTPALTVSGVMPAAAATARPRVEDAAVDNPTHFFLEALRLALGDRGIRVSGGVAAIDDVPAPPLATRNPPPSTRRIPIATRTSLPLSNFGAYFLKTSQNLYGETLLKTLGRSVASSGLRVAGSAAAGKTVVKEVLTAWGIPADSYAMVDGSGLSRYNYVSSDALVAILTHVWKDEKLRGPFLALLPVAGRDGTLSSRMKGTALDARVQAKTGTISNVRSLSGFLETKSGERLVFSIIANNFTASSAEIDAIVEKALARLAER